MMTDDTTQRRAARYWERFIDRDGRWRDKRRPPGQDLAAMRRGTGKAPGTVPGMWALHTELADGRGRGTEIVGLTPHLTAEHHALVLFGFHQQGLDQPVHEPGVGVGEAIHHLRASGRYSEDAVERRFFAAVTADSVDEVAEHLRRLVQQLRVIRRGAQRGGTLDYSRLQRDLERWHNSAWRGEVRRTWASQYEWQPRTGDSKTGDPNDEAPVSAGA